MPHDDGPQSAWRDAGTGPAAGRRLLVAAGLLSAWNGAVHLVLPVIFPWQSHTMELYEPVRWALYAGTIFFGLLLLWAGLLVVALARQSDPSPTVDRWVFGGLAVFWLLGAAYEVVAPFPAPVVDLALPVFSVAVAVLLLAGLRRRLHDEWHDPPAPSADADNQEAHGDGIVRVRR